MKLALVIERFDPAGGGAERNVAELAAHLSGRGHEVTVVTASVADDLDAAAFPWRIHAMGSRKPRTAARLLRFAAHARQHLTQAAYDASLSVTMTVPASVVQPLGGTVAETQRRNVAMRDGAARFGKAVAIALSPKQQALRRLESRTLASPLVHRFAALSRYAERQLVEAGVEPSRIVLIPNAVEVPRLTPEQRRVRREKVRAGLRLTNDITAFLFAAMNPRLKGFQPLLDALAVLRKQGRDAVLLAAGECSYPEHRMALRVGVRDMVRLVGLTGNMASLYCAADCTVLPTFYDPASRVVIESVAMGTPAITTRYNGAADWVELPGGRRCGRVIDDPRDVESLAAAMGEMTDPAARDACRRAAGSAAILSIEQHVDAVEALLREAAAGG